MTIQELGAQAALAITQATGAPGQVWLTTAVLVAGLYLLVGVAATSVSRRAIGKSHHLTIETSETDAVDEIWMNGAAMKAAGLKWGDTVRIQGQGAHAYKKPRYARLRMRRGLGDDQIELSPDLQVLLFKDLPSGGPFRRIAFAPGVRKGGFEEFWFHPNEQMRFQNRLGIYLALGLPAFQLALEWATG